MESTRLNYKNKLPIMIGAFIWVTILAFPAAAQDTEQDAPPEAVVPVDPAPSPTLIVAPVEAEAEPAADEVDTPKLPRLTGDLPERIRKVNVDASGDTIAEILQTVARQANLGIVMDPAAPALQKEMTIKLRRKPFTDVLEIILEAGSLSGELKGDILFVTPREVPEEVEEDNEDGVTDVVLEAGSDEDGAYVQVKTNKHKKSGKTRSKRYHDNNRVQVGKAVHVKAGETVDDAVAVGAPLTVEGTVRGDAVAVGGSLIVKPTAHIHGDAVSVGGGLSIEEGAVVEGEQVGVGIPFPIEHFIGEDGELRIHPPHFSEDLADALGTINRLGVILKSALLFLLALIINAMFPKRIDRVIEYINDHIGYAVLAGVIMPFAVITLTLLLIVTLIGIPLVFVVFLAMALLLAFGMTAFIAWLGDKIPLLKNKKNRIGAMAIGAMAIMLVNLIPFVGPVLVGCVSLIAAGAAFLTKLGKPTA